MAALGAAPPAGLHRPLLPPPTGAAGTQPAQHRVRGADTDWAGSRVPGEPVTRSRGPRRAGTLLGALRPRPLVPLFNVAMSSVFGKPRAGSGPQSAPLEVNLAILGRRGAGKSGEWGGCREGKGIGRDRGASGGNWELCTCGLALALALGASCSQVGWAKQIFFIASVSSVAWRSLCFVLISISYLFSVPCMARPLCLPTVFLCTCL